ncbi:MAG: outer membrane lipoprotein carrier protein LolA [Pseudomonadota bacterium]
MRFGRSVPFVFGMVAAFIAGGGAWANELVRIRRAAEGIRSIKAEFVQQKKLKILVKPLVSTGEFLFARPGSIRWEYKNPIQSLVLVHKGDVRRFSRRGSDGLVEDSGGSVEAMGVAMSEIGLWMGGRFDESKAFAPLFVPGTPNRVELRPRDKSMARFVTKIVVTFSSVPGVIEALDIMEGECDSTHIEFRDVKLNLEIQEKMFRDAK